MIRTASRHWVAPLLAALLCASLDAAPALTRELATACARKFETIGKSAPVPGSPRRIPMTEAELNAWLLFTGSERLPVGVTEPSVSLLGDGRASGRAVVDLDLMGRKKGSRGLLDPWSYLGGRMPVSATGTLHTEAGVGRFVLESAQVSGIPVPKWLLQELVSFYARSPSRPKGISIDDPFPLPAGIDSLDVGLGQVVVVQ